MVSSTEKGWRVFEIESQLAEFANTDRIERHEDCRVPCGFMPEGGMAIRSASARMILRTPPGTLSMDAVSKTRKK